MLGEEGEGPNHPCDRADAGREVSAGANEASCFERLIMHGTGVMMTLAGCQRLTRDCLRC